MLLHFKSRSKLGHKVFAPSFLKSSLCVSGACQGSALCEWEDRPHTVAAETPSCSIMDIGIGIPATLGKLKTPTFTAWPDTSEDRAASAEFTSGNHKREDSTNKTQNKNRISCLQQFA